MSPEDAAKQMAGQGDDPPLIAALRDDCRLGHPTRLDPSATDWLCDLIDALAEPARQR